MYERYLVPAPEIKDTNPLATIISFYGRWKNFNETRQVKAILKKIMSESQKSNELQLRSSEFVNKYFDIEVFKGILNELPKVTSIDLSENDFSKRLVMLNVLLRNLPERITSINLAGNNILNIPEANLKQILNFFKNRNIILSEKEVNGVSQNKIHFLLNNIDHKNIILMDNEGLYHYPGSIKHANTLRKAGITTNVPTLLTQCFLFTAKKLNENKEIKTQFLKEINSISLPSNTSTYF